MKRRNIAIVCALAIGLLLAYSRAVGAQQGVTINGCGATFPAPLYTHWFKTYKETAGIQVGYNAVGSGKGIASLLEFSVDFGATDATLSDAELARAPAPIVHIPTCLGGVAVTYDLPDNPALKFRPSVLADIFLGKITRWGDSRITVDNPSARLPDLPIVVVHRSDESGTTFVFTDYLCKVSDVWQKDVGCGKLLNWPTGLGARTNSKVAALIRRTPGSIGYVELTYALSERLPVAAIQSASGVFVTPSTESVSLAGEVDLPADTRILITNTEARGGYPIGSFTWIICYREQNYQNRSREQAVALVRLLWWMIHDGQQHGGQFHYAALPRRAVEKAENIVRSMTFNGAPIAIEDEFLRAVSTTPPETSPAEKLAGRTAAPSLAGWLPAVVLGLIVAGIGLVLFRRFLAGKKVVG